LQQFRCRAVIEDRMIPFATYTAAETPNYLTPKLPLFSGVVTPSNDSWSRRVSPSNKIPIGLAVLHSTSVCSTHKHRQTDKHADHLRATSVAISRMYERQRDALPLRHYGCSFYDTTRCGTLTCTQKLTKWPT